MKIHKTSRNATIAIAAFTISLATGGLWASQTPSAPAHQAGCEQVFAGRAGVLPCVSRNDPQDRAARKFVGTTVSGCVLGFVGKGGPWGCLYGGIGGMVGNIPW